MEVASGKLIGVCVLERLPVVVPDEPDWDIEYRAWQAVRTLGLLLLLLGCVCVCKGLPGSSPDFSRQSLLLSASASFRKCR